MPQNDVINFLLAADSRDTLLVTDFDGTLYRGMFPAWSRGISNVDLALFLCLLHVSRPVREMRILTGCIRVWLLDRILSRDYSAGRITLSEMDRELIEFFSQRVLRRCLPSRIERAANLVSRLCYRDADAVLELLQNRVGCILIISKAFAFVLDISAARMRQRMKPEIHSYGVSLQPASSWRIDCSNSILTRDDKSTCLRAFLRNNPRFRRAIVVGDTEDDIALYEVCRACIEPGKVLTVSIQSKDKKILAASDHDFSSWGAFHAFLSNNCRIDENCTV